MLQFISAVNNDQNFAMNCRFSWNFKEEKCYKLVFLFDSKKEKCF